MRRLFFIGILVTAFSSVYGDITVNIISPTVNQVVDGVLNIQVNIQSTYELKTVTAIVNDRQAKLSYNSSTTYFEG